MVINQKSRSAQGLTSSVAMETLESRLMLSASLSMADFYPLVDLSQYTYSLKRDDGSSATLVRDVAAGADAGTFALTDTIDATFDSAKLLSRDADGTHLLIQSWGIFDGDGTQIGTDFLLYDPASPATIFPATMQVGSEFADLSSFEHYHTDSVYDASNPFPDVATIQAMDDLGAGTLAIEVRALGFYDTVVGSGAGRDTFTTLNLSIGTTMVEQGSQISRDNYVLALSENFGQVSRSLDWSILSKSGGVTTRLTGNEQSDLVAGWVPDQAMKHVHVGSKGVSYQDAANNKVTVSITGGGSGDLFFASDADLADATSLSMANTSSRSTFNVTVAKNGTTNINDVRLHSSLGTFNAAKLNLLDSFVADSGTGISTIKFNDVSGEMTLSKTDKMISTNMTFRKVDALTLQTEGRIGSLSAAALIDSTIGVGIDVGSVDRDNPTLGSEFTEKGAKNKVTLTTLTLTGLTEAGTTTYMSGTNIAAYGIQTVKFGAKNKTVDDSMIRTTLQSKITNAPVTALADWFTKIPA